MGGSSGGYSDYSFDRGEGGSLDCTKLNFETTLLSTNPDALETLKVGQSLEVKRGEYSATVVTTTGDHVGSIVTNASQLLACIDSGNKYIAEILEIDEGACRVKVSYADA
jgi:hypothetical protein